MTTFATESDYIKAARKVKAKSRKGTLLFQPVITLSAFKGHSRREAMPVLAEGFIK